MEFWLAWFHETNNGETVKTIAQAAEDMGYSGVALSDHVALPREQMSRHPLRGIPYDPAIPNIEPLTTAATMAAVTQKLQFLTYAYVMGMRDPFTVAKQAGALSDLSGNRFSLGITPGWNTDEIQLLGHNPETRGSRFRESIEVMQGLWQNDLFSYEGRHFNFRDVGLSPRPDQPPAIYIGGNSPIAIKRAANQSGWIAMNHSIEELTPLLSQLHELSEGRARNYVIADAPLTDKYTSQLSSLGVVGIVVMPWEIMHPDYEQVGDKLEAMRKMAQFWR